MMAACSRGAKGTMLVLIVFVLACLLQPCASRPDITDYFDDELEVDEINKDDELLAAALNDLPANGELFEGDIIMDNRLRRAIYGEKEKKSVAKKKVKWPGGIVPYEIDPTFPKKHREMLKEAQKEFESRTCIRFKKRDMFEDDNYVYYTNASNECSSSVGMIGGKQTITLGKDCGVLGTFEHENMHALGFIHEHSRPDRDDYVKVRFENIKKAEASNFQKYSMEDVVSYQPLNFASIMMYRNNAFSKNGKDTIQSLEKPDLNFGQRIKFSCGDIYAINKLYDCKGFLVHPNCHHLYAAFHTVARKKKKKKKKDLVKSALKKFWESVVSLYGDEVGMK